MSHLAKTRFLIISMLIICGISNCKNDVLKNQASYEAPENSEISMELNGIGIKSIKEQIIDFFNQPGEYSETEYQLSESEDKEHYILTYSSISEPDYQAMVHLSKNVKNYITGDVNGDGLSDLIVCPFTEFANAQSVSTFYAFLFLRKKNQLKLENIYEESYFDQCEEFGKWKVTEISNGVIYGMLSCYGEDDARCCPSIESLTKFRYNETTGDLEDAE